MDLPVLTSYEEGAADVVAFVLNKAKSGMGIHQSLKELADTKKGLRQNHLVNTGRITAPTASSSRRFIKEMIDETWELSRTLSYHINYVKCSTDELSRYYYFEVIFSQPTPRYPIPQATVSVFFRVQEMQTVPTKDTVAQKMTFRIEGQSTDYDVRFVRLTQDMILATLKMKLNLFKRIEDMELF